mmetsp:Transcript_56545/g.129868  ORF Transcript_56545/g.129868 Transcript_56545/m.129868 type:complete len:226 (+) Transcript_56545:1593-2270(+)
MKLIGAVRTGLLYDYSGTVADAYHFLLEEIMDRVDVLESVSHPSWEAVWFESCARPKTASAAIAAGITMAPLDRAWGDVQCCLNAESLEAQGQSGVTWPGYKGKSALVVSWENMNSCSSPGGVHWQTLEGDGWTLVKWRFSGCEAKEPGIYRALKENCCPSLVLHEAALPGPCRSEVASSVVSSLCWWRLSLLAYYLRQTPRTWWYLLPRAAWRKSLSAQLCWRL